MADIFISYSQEEADITIGLSQALEKQGYTTWWDTSLLPGEEFPQIIQKEINTAKAVIVIWTPTSILSRWVRSEAHFADEQNKLITVHSGTLPKNSIPMPFNTYHTPNVKEIEKIIFACRRFAPKPANAERQSHISTMPDLLKKYLNTTQNFLRARDFVEDIIRYKYKYLKNVQNQIEIQEINTRSFIDSNGDASTESHIYIKCIKEPLNFWIYEIDGDKESDEIKFLHDLNFSAVDVESGKLLEWFPVRDKSIYKRFAIFFQDIKSGQYKELRISYHWPGYVKKLIQTGSVDFWWRYLSQSTAKILCEVHFLRTFVPIDCEFIGNMPKTASLTKELRGEGFVWKYRDPQAALTKQSAVQLRFKIAE